MLIKLVIIDFDGVFTDKIYYSNSGEMFKSVNPKDTYGLQILKNNNIKIGIVTACNSTVVDNISKIMSRIDYINKGDYKKFDIIQNWSLEHKINLKNIAYIGDDIYDASFMDKLGFSGCPSDAVNECKQVASYICVNKGGDGAVREFIEKILENNRIYEKNIKVSEIDISHIQNNGKVTAVIPVRSGSTRCKNKNIRDFGDTNLLKRKIELLKRVKNIDEILVSSNCDEMLQIADDLNVSTHKRDQLYCSNTCSGSDMHLELARNIKNEILLYTHCVAPFNTNYEQLIDMFKSMNKNEFDSVASVNNIQNFMWYNNSPINYNSNNAPPSQLLPKYSIPTFGCNIIYTKDVFKCRNIIGQTPKFIEVDNIEAIDIDHPHEFVTAELLYNNNIETENDALNLLKRRDSHTKIELLDCTIRDGGYLNNWNFSDEEVLECYQL